MSADGEYIACLFCGNIKEGEAIYRCDNCGQMFCYQCKLDSLSSYICPKCKERMGFFGSSPCGHIKRPS